MVEVDGISLIYCVQCNSPVSSVEQYCPKCGTSIISGQKKELTSMPPVSPGTELVEKYRITEVSTINSFNTYRALVLGSDREVIIDERKSGGFKTVRLSEINQLTADTSSGDIVPVAIGRKGLSLKEEYQLMSALNGLYANGYLDYFTWGQREFLVHALPVGKSLLSFADGRPIDYKTSIEIAIQLCRITGIIHQLGFLHLGIEPANINWTEKYVQLTNFANASRQGVQRPYYLTSDGFSAPELMVPDRVNIDTRADIYAIGAVLYWMLTGERLNLKGLDSQNIFADVSSTELARILLKCLASDANERFKTVEELGSRLEALIPDIVSDVQFNSAALTDTGILRANNEDAFLLLEFSKFTDSREEKIGLYIVADGMGGHKSGEIASRKAVETIGARITGALMSPTEKTDYNILIKDAIEIANNDIYVMSKSDASLAAMGTTVTLGLRVNNALYIGHVGDSRCYLVRDGKMVQLTEDHSVIAGLLKRGLINDQQAKLHPDRGKILRSLGSPGSVTVDSLEAMGHSGPLILSQGDIVIFCTDGLTGELTVADLLNYISTRDSAAIICRNLINAANLGGGQDNCTVITIKTGAEE